MGNKPSSVGPWNLNMSADADDCFLKLESNWREKGRGEKNFKYKRVLAANPKLWMQACRCGRGCRPLANFVPLKTLLDKFQKMGTWESSVPQGPFSLLLVLRIGPKAKIASAYSRQSDISVSYPSR